MGNAQVLHTQVLARDRRGVDVIGRSLFEERMHRLEGRHAFGGRVELGTDPPQRPVRLGSQKKHEQRRAELHPSGGESDPDGDGHQGNGQGGYQLQDCGRGEGKSQGAERGAPVAIGDLANACRLGSGTAIRHERGQPADDIEEVSRQRRHGAPLLLGPVAGGQSDQSSEDRDQGQCHQHDGGAEKVLCREDRHCQRR